MDNHDGGRADWDDIKTFVAAAQAGSFGAAARRLRTSQPTITRRIDDLETRLGCGCSIAACAGSALPGLASGSMTGRFPCTGPRWTSNAWPWRPTATTPAR
uniref:LysR family transcriptional regulator n=1 Tax=Phenylobacterium glaciei TaxID=2803784 RepID=A0A974P1F2_9CAUL|nr:LysR family transcriptional regulator [Phenylobacterium glaciei]